MKRILVVILIAPFLSFGQSRSISGAKKIKEPYVTMAKDTLKLEQKVTIGMGSNPDGSFKYIQLLNSFNEPVKAADSRLAMKKQEVKFFKEQDGAMYMFTKYAVINIEAALISKELIIQ